MRNSLKENNRACAHHNNTYFWLQVLRKFRMVSTSISLCISLCFGLWVWPSDMTVLFILHCILKWSYLRLQGLLAGILLDGYLNCGPWNYSFMNTTAWSPFVSWFFHPFLYQIPVQRKVNSATIYSNWHDSHTNRKYGCQAVCGNKCILL